MTALYTLKRALYTLKRALYTLKRALYTLKRALYTLKRALYTLKTWQRWAANYCPWTRRERNRQQQLLSRRKRTETMQRTALTHSGRAWFSWGASGVRWFRVAPLSWMSIRHSTYMGVNHGPHVEESWPICGWVITHIHDTSRQRRHPACQCVMTHTCGRIKALMWMSHDTHL